MTKNKLTPLPPWVPFYNFFSWLLNKPWRRAEMTNIITSVGNPHNKPIPKNNSKVIYFPRKRND